MKWSLIQSVAELDGLRHAHPAPARRGAGARSPNARRGPLDRAGLVGEALHRRRRGPNSSWTISLFGPARRSTARLALDRASPGRRSSATISAWKARAGRWASALVHAGASTFRPGCVRDGDPRPFDVLSAISATGGGQLDWSRVEPRLSPRSSAGVHADQRPRTTIRVAGWASAHRPSVAGLLAASSAPASWSSSNTAVAGTLAASRPRPLVSGA